MYSSIAEQFSQFWHAPTQRMLRMFVREMPAHAQLSLVRFDARLRVLSSVILQPFSLLFRLVGV